MCQSYIFLYVCEHALLVFGYMFQDSDNCVLMFIALRTMPVQGHFPR